MFFHRDLVPKLGPKCDKKLRKRLYLNNIRARSKRNARFLIKYKKYCGCKFCGEKKVDLLTFHHIDKRNKKAPNKLRRHHISRIKEEVRKCVVLCRKCHVELHRAEQRGE